MRRLVNFIYKTTLTNLNKFFILQFCGTRDNWFMLNVQENWTIESFLVISGQSILMRMKVETVTKLLNSW